MRYEAHLALRYLRFRRGTKFLSVITAISLAGVAVGAAALVIALAMQAGLVEDLLARIRAGSAHLVVLGRSGEEFFSGADELRARVEATAGVEAAAAVVHTPALVVHEAIGEKAFVEVHGVEPERHGRVIADGASSLAALGKVTAGGRPGIVLGRELAGKIGVFEGDTVRIVVPSVSVTALGMLPRSRTFEVVGTASSGYLEDESRAYIALDQARGMLRLEDGTSWVGVRLDDPRRIAEMKRALAESLGSGWAVADLVEQNRALIKALNSERLLLMLAIGLIVAVAALNIASTLILTVNDKLRSIGTLTAMGARPRGIASVFVIQGLVIGAIGSVTGIVLGAGAAWLLDRYELIRVDPKIYYFHHIPFSVRALDLVTVAVGVFVVSLLATVYPALKAASLDPVEAIRYE